MDEQKVRKAAEVASELARCAPESSGAWGYIFQAMLAEPYDSASAATQDKDTSES